MNPLKIDLHMHSTASDGVHAPAALVALTARHGLDVIALTDHDNVAGVCEALAAGHELGVTVLRGTEISAQASEDVEVDILAYMIDLNNETLRDKLRFVSDGRYGRAVAIVRKLNDLGVRIAIGDVMQAAGDAVAIARPHIAQAMVNIGFVPTKQDAFDRYISDDGPAYVAHPVMTPDEIIDAVHEAGGLAVLAHPGRLDDFEPEIALLIKAGLDGLEVYHPSNTPADSRRLELIAAENDLLVTGGSDYHGTDPAIAPGMWTSPPDTLEKMKARVKRYR